MELGLTHYRWRRDAERMVYRLEARHPDCKANTYVDHPWPGWDRVSADFWHARGRGWAIDGSTGRKIVEWLLENAERLNIRHIIYRRGIWTSWGGWSTWPSYDHSGDLRHVHVTLWL